MLNLMQYRDHKKKVRLAQDHHHDFAQSTPQSASHLSENTNNSSQPWNTPMKLVIPTPGSNVLVSACATPYTAHGSMSMTHQIGTCLCSPMTPVVPMTPSSFHLPKVSSSSCLTQLTNSASTKKPIVSSH